MHQRILLSEFLFQRQAHWHSMEDTLAAWSLLCVQRCGCHVPWLTWKRWQVLGATPHLLGRATRGNHTQGWLHTPMAQWLQKLAQPHQLQHQLMASSVRQVFNIVLMWLHFAHSINWKDNPISKIHLGEWLNPSTQQGSFPDHQGTAEQYHRPDFSARA